MTENSVNAQLSPEKHPTSVDIPKKSSYRHSLPESYVKNLPVSTNWA